MVDKRSRLAVLLRVGPAVLAASVIASWIVNWSVILPYENRKAFWGEMAWRVSLLATDPSAYTNGVFLNWLMAGLPAAALSLMAVLILHPTRRWSFLVALLIGPTFMVLPAWWFFAWFGPWYLALAAAAISASLASLIFVGAATLAGCVPAGGRSGSPPSERRTDEAITRRLS